MTAAQLHSPHAPPEPPACSLDSPLALLEELLQQRGDLSAVERFAQQAFVSPLATRARRYRDLLPATPPADNEQYAFEVDLDVCSGCKACVTACHSLNGLDDDEAFREVGFLHGGANGSAVIQHVTTACHHCLDPACLNACPVNAYEKDSHTGIVRHLDDQCFGCQYCILACPYDAPKYNRQKGIVRKCDMCSQRLAVGEPPACAQACPTQAIRIRTVSHDEVLRDCETDFYLPGAPSPQHTLPTTSYKTRRALPRNLLPADYYSLRPDDSHPALVVMLVLTQLSVGTFLVDYLLQQGGSLALADAAPARAFRAAGALLAGIVALAASTLHLGRPKYAYRAVVGFKHSWLSREIVCFGVFAFLATAYAIGSWQTHDTFKLAPTAGTWDVAVSWLGGAVVMCGLAGVACSTMIYRSTRRPCWSGASTTLKFALCTVVLGISGSLLLAFAAAALTRGFTLAAVYPESGIACETLVVALLAKLLYEALQLAHRGARTHTPQKRSAMLLLGPLRRWLTTRFALGLIAIACFLVLRQLTATADSDASGHWVGITALVGFVSLLAGEVCERHLFFTASVAPRMPGGVIG